VTRIEFDVCPTEAAAIHREELLTCVLNPKFNGVGKVFEDLPGYQKLKPFEKPTRVNIRDACAANATGKT